MRKLVVCNIVWLDGFYSGPGGDVMAMPFDDGFSDPYRRPAVYIDKSLNGAKPGDLPIEQPTRFDFVVNRKTANALGVTLPRTILLVDAANVFEGLTYTFEDDRFAYGEQRALSPSVSQRS